jgi:cephalosporin hydroxylase
MSDESDSLFTYNQNNIEINAIEYIEHYTSDYKKEGKILYDTILELNAKIIVDLGIRGGCSTRVCLLGAKETNGEVYSCDIIFPEKSLKDFIEKYGLKKYWHLHIGDDIEFASQIDKKIDILLLDSNHETQHVIAQLVCYPEKVSPLGRIFIHDSKYQSVEDAINAFMLNNNKWIKIEHDTTLGYAEFRRI